MKQICTFLLTAALAFTLAACGVSTSERSPKADAAPAASLREYIMQFESSLKSMTIPLSMDSNGSFARVITAENVDIEARQYLEEVFIAHIEHDLPELISSRSEVRSLSAGSGDDTLDGAEADFICQENGTSYFLISAAAKHDSDMILFLALASEADADNLKKFAEQAIREYQKQFESGAA